MTLNEARDRIVAADTEKRGVLVQANCWHFTSGSEETIFEVQIANTCGEPNGYFTSPAINGALAQALEYLAPPADNTAEAKGEDHE